MPRFQLMMAFAFATMATMAQAESTTQEDAAYAVHVYEQHLPSLADCPPMAP